MIKECSFDLVVPIHNSLVHVRACLESIAVNSGSLATVYLVNDGSDSQTSEVLLQFANDHPEFVRLIVNDENLGYLKSVNKGILSGSSEFVILVNSDSLMFPGTLERLKETFSRDEQIAVINPVSTWANWTKIPFPAGTNIRSIHEFVSRFSGDVSDIGNASGFFFAVRRSVFNKLGVFDEAFNPGYWEEADFCMRALSEGYRVVVDPKLFVFHHGWGSFQKEARDQNMNRNRDVFMRRWQRQYEDLEYRWSRNNPLNDLISDMEERLPVLPDRESIVFIFDKSLSDFEKISWFHTINALIRDGINANAIILGSLKEIDFRNTPMYFRPIEVKEDGDLPRGFKADVAFTIGRKALFFAVGMQRKFGSLKIVRYDGLKNDLTLNALNEINSAELPIHFDEMAARPAINDDVFYPDLSRDNGKVLLCLSSNLSDRDHSNFIRIMREAIHGRLPDRVIEVVRLHGSRSDLKGGEVDILSSERQFAERLRRSVVVVIFEEGSAAVNAGLATLASGSVLVTKFGGPCGEFTRHRINSILVHEWSPEAIANAVLEAVDGPAASSGLIQQGLVTSGRFTTREAARAISGSLLRLREDAGIKRVSLAGV